jgi:hypothetical protein
VQYAPASMPYLRVAAYAVVLYSLVQTTIWRTATAADIISSSKLETCIRNGTQVGATTALTCVQVAKDFIQAIYFTHSTFYNELPRMHGLPQPTCCCQGLTVPDALFTNKQTHCLSLPFN